MYRILHSKGYEKKQFALSHNLWAFYSNKYESIYADLIPVKYSDCSNRNSGSGVLLMWNV